MMKLIYRSVEIIITSAAGGGTAFDRGLSVCEQANSTSGQRILPTGRTSWGIFSWEMI